MRNQDKMDPSLFYSDACSPPHKNRTASRSRTDLERHKSKPRTNTESQKSTSSAYGTFPCDDEHLSGSFLEWLTTDMAHEPLNHVSAEISDDDTPTDHSTRYSRSAMPKKQGDLLGLNPHALNNALSDNETKTASASCQILSSESITACTAHRALLTKSNSCAISGGLVVSGAPNLSIPMDRFLSEGKAERYALLSISHSEKDQAWTRFSGCHCWKVSEGDWK